MTNPFVAEIRIFAGNFAPTGWATCDGQILPISQNTALFSLLGTTYGGDGKSTFALPDMAGSAPVGQGQGSGGLSERFLGETGGEPNISLLTSEMPQHNHFVAISTENGAQGTLTNGVVLGKSGGGTLYQNGISQNLVQMNPQALGMTGNSLPHNNLPPYLAMTFIIALQGVFPPRP
ncbi:phage tail protein [Mesorhizobium sp. BH1-1-4]|uniref:phage tail protein n=1 Tax=Mesorhizobium sp. BH1-1-4 TaxID=2876662 RepID=UPI001CD053F3|nr:tail fiber protein [Mesorhizobium sp. BH1-1-4]MBZ9997832.1 tail fiber protein [Mesorhizobium sp. BH1-1-4]